MEDLAKFFSGSVYWEEEDERKSKLSVRIVRGVNLPKGNSLYDFDVFVEMIFFSETGEETHVFKTEIVKDSTNPTWNYEASVPLNPILSGPDERFITFRVVQWDGINDRTLLLVQYFYLFLVKSYLFFIF